MRSNVLIYDYAKRKRVNLYPQMRKTNLGHSIADPISRRI
jgi:hypothetical protein